MSEKFTPTLYLIAGSNGAGKTTLAREFLPTEVRCLNFLNADLLAQGLSPLDPTAAALRAGRVLLHEFERHVAERTSFGLESTLSGLSYLERLQNAKDKGFRLVIFYLWVGSAQLAIERVRQRVAKGGHHVPSADVTRRFLRSVRHFFNHYQALAQEYYIFDNRGDRPLLIACGTESSGETVIDADRYTELLSCHDQDS